MTIKVIAFDLDGVLWDSKDLHYQALNSAIKPYCGIISEEEQKTIYEGLPTKIKLKMLTINKNLSPELYDTVSTMKQELTAKLLSTEVKPKLQHKRLLNKLRGDGYKLAITSNSIRATVNAFIKASEMDHVFDLVLSNEDVQNPKPSAEIYNKTIKYFNISPGELLVLEDSDTGLNAAYASQANVLKVDGGSTQVNTHFVYSALESFND